MSDNDKNPVRLTFRGRVLYERAKKEGRIKSLHQAARRADISYPTAFGYCKKNLLDRPDKIQSTTLYKFLVDGLGYTPDELRDMSFLEIFAITQGEQVLETANVTD